MGAYYPDEICTLLYFCTFESTKPGTQTRKQCTFVSGFCTFIRMKFVLSFLYFCLILAIQFPYAFVLYQKRHSVVLLIRYKGPYSLFATSNNIACVSLSLRYMQKV